MLLLSLRVATVCIFLLLALSVSVNAGISAPYQILTGAKNPIVWQESDPWLVVTEDLAAGRTCYYYNPTFQSKMSLKPAAPGTWMPLGSAIKWLIYVDHYQDLDRIMAHDVDIHVDHIAWPSSQNQIGCGMSDMIYVYGQYRSTAVGDHYPVDLWKCNIQSGDNSQITTSDSEKSQFAHDGNLIVYRAYFGSSDVRICGCYFSSGTEFDVAKRNGIEPSVCGAIVAWAEANGSGYNIVGKNLTTGEIRTIAYTTADSPRPETGRDAIFWQTLGATSGLDIRGYHWQTNQEFVVTSASGDQSQLRVCDDMVTWVTGSINYRTLWGAALQPPVQITDLRPTLITQDSVTLAWTSPNSIQNPPVSYDLRTRRDAPITDANWTDSTSITGLPVPKSPGQTETFTVSPLSNGAHYYALRARLTDNTYTLLSNDICAFVSPQSNVFSATPGAYISYTGVVTGTGANGAIFSQRPTGIEAVRAFVRTGEASVSAGQSATITGVLTPDTDLVGPVLQQASVSIGAGTQTPLCFALSTKSLTTINTWMLMKVWGRVSRLTVNSGCSLYIDDGSGRGVYVTSRYAPPAGLANNAITMVSGIARLSRRDGWQIEVVSDGEVQVIQ